MMIHRMHWSSRSCWVLLLLLLLLQGTLLVNHQCHAWMIPRGCAPLIQKAFRAHYYSTTTTTTTTRQSSSLAVAVIQVSANEDDDDDENNNNAPIRAKLQQQQRQRQQQPRHRDRHHRQLILYNSKSRCKEPFQPINDPIAMYTCGPTVYDAAHVGNFRAFLTYDLLKRVLLYLGFAVHHVCNLTDVDDKIIQRANERQLSDITTLTKHYEDLFLQDLAALNILPATAYPRATEHIAEMMSMIQILAQKGLAYTVSDGSWYFRTQASAGYGQQLVQLNYEEMEQQQADLEDSKEHFADFCLWKAFKEGIDREDAAWASSDFVVDDDDDATNAKNNDNDDANRAFGSVSSSPVIAKGRPGWHLECSAMARKFFGDKTLDLHGGGIDLKFPHHENEIAQSQGASSVDGQIFCSCWFHNGFVNIGDEKMSKSLGNFLTLRKACPTADDVRAYRYLVVSSHYRNPLAFTKECMKAAKSAIKRMDKVMEELQIALKDYSSSSGGGGGGDDNDDKKDVDSRQQRKSEIANTIVPKAIENFELAITDDLSMPRAAASFFTLVKAAEQEFKRVAKNSSHGAASGLDLVGLHAIQSAMKQMDTVFGIFYQVPVTEEEAQAQAARQEEAATIPDEVLDLVSQRTAAKEAKDWELADSLRKRITELGFVVKDVKGGEPIVSRVD